MSRNGWPAMTAPPATRNPASPTCNPPLRLLAVSDIVEPQLYSTGLPDWIGPVDAVLGCGDLPDYYLEFLLTVLNVPCFYVRGNHCGVQHNQAGRDLADVAGAENLHGRVVRWRG